MLDCKARGCCLKRLAAPPATLCGHLIQECLDKRAQYFIFLRIIKQQQYNGVKHL